MDILSWILGYKSGLKKGGGGGTGEPAILASGVFTSGVTWELAATGLLTISGTGAMDEYTAKANQPWYDYQSDIKYVVIDSGVTSIGDHAFYDCTQLRDINIPSTVTSIGKMALAYTAVGSITIPSGVKTIGVQAFQGCKLFGVIIPNSVTTIGDGAFMMNGNLASVTIGSGVTSIGRQAFAQSGSKLVSATFQDTSTWYVGDTAGATTTSVSVTNASTNASNLRSTSAHANKYWTKV